MDLGILNTVIAMVIVLLVLSLLVQSVQMLLKKLLKLKSKQIEDSLKDLYDQAIGGGPSTALPPANENNPAALVPVSASGQGLVATVRHAASLAIIGKTDTASAAAENFTQKVLDEFQKIGRVTKYGKPVLESLSKEDLFKVMAKFESKDFFPDYAEKFKDVLQPDYRAADSRRKHQFSIAGSRKFQAGADSGRHGADLQQRGSYSRRRAGQAKRLVCRPSATSPTRYWWRAETA